MSASNNGRADGAGRVYQASGDQHIIEHHHHGPSWGGPDSVRHPAVGRAPVVLRDRAELMRRLRGAVAAEHGNEVLVLHGLGGCGKTAVAYTLFQHATTEGGRLGFWINASEQGSLRAGMLALAADRGVGADELMAARSGLRAAADLVWDCLDRSDEPWLLVLDNADDPAVLKDGGWLRTSPRGTVLVTTRQAAPHWWPAAELLHVAVLPRTDAAQVLIDLAPGTGTVQEAADIADRLGRLPLALTLAGGFLAHQVVQPWTMTEYGGHLEGRRGADPIELIDQGAEQRAVDDSRSLVGRTWQLSLDSLIGQGLPEAVHLLRLLACWSSDPLPLSLLAGADLGADLPPLRVELALRGLLDHSLTELLTGDVRCLRTHGVVLDSVASGIPENQRETLVATAARLIKGAIPEIPERGVKDDRVELLAPHVPMLLRRAMSWPGVSLPGVEAAVECALQLAVAQHRAGDYASALAVTEEAAEMGAARLGTDHPLVLRLRQRMGRALLRLGKTGRAEALHREVLADCERIFGPAGLDTLESCVALSFPLWQVGHDTESVLLLRRAVAGRTEALGRTHPLTLVARMYLLELDGPVSPEIVETGAALYEDCETELGRDHQLTGAAELSYANALFFSGRPTEAYPLSVNALSRHESRYGRDYLMTQNARSLLCQVLGALGRDSEATEQTEILVDSRKRVLGLGHQWTRDAQELLSAYREKNTP